MARKRTISPTLWENEEALGLTDAAFRVWIGLWSVCDRNGVFEWRPRKWVFRFAPRSHADPDQVFQELVDARFVAPFEAQGEPYGFCIKWAKHQDPHISEAPQYPMPAGDPRFTPCPPRGWTKANAKWAFEVYGLTPSGASTAPNTGASTGASTCTRPSSPSCPSCPSKEKEEDGPPLPSLGQGSPDERQEHVHPPAPHETAPGLGSGPPASCKASPIGDLADWDDVPLVAQALHPTPHHENTEKTA